MIWWLALKQALDCQFLGIGIRLDSVFQIPANGFALEGIWKDSEGPYCSALHTFLKEGVNESQSLCCSGFGC